MAKEKVPPNRRRFKTPKSRAGDRVVLKPTRSVARALVTGKRKVSRMNPSAASDGLMEMIPEMPRPAASARAPEKGAAAA